MSEGEVLPSNINQTIDLFFNCNLGEVLVRGRPRLVFVSQFLAFNIFLREKQKTFSPIKKREQFFLMALTISIVK